MSAPLVEVRNVSQTFRVRDGLFGRPRRVVAVDGVSLTLNAGEVIGVVAQNFKYPHQS